MRNSTRHRQGGNAGNRDAELRDTRHRLRKDRWKVAAKSVTDAAFPNANETIDGVVYPGIDIGMKARDESISSRLFPKENLAGGKKGIPRLPGDVVVEDVNIRKLNGTKIEANSLPEGAINGTGQGGKVAWGIIDHPDLAPAGHNHGTYITNSELNTKLNGYATQHWVKSHVKESAWIS